jgi:hypothetical protein
MIPKEKLTVQIQNVVPGPLNWPQNAEESILIYPKALLNY